MLIDSHAHLDFESYNQDRKEVIRRCLDKGMKVINVGSQLETSKLATKIAQDYDDMYAVIGIHPIHVFDESFNPADYQALLDNNKKIVAIGECGYDYFYIKEASKSFSAVKAKQTEVFMQQIQLAKANNLPLMIHGRNGQDHPHAYKDILEMLQEEDCHQGLIHCYGGNMEESKLFLQQGFHIGFTGIVTFAKKAEELQVIAKMMPLDRIIIETDSPYLSPVPHRGERNEPVNVEFVARKIAELKGLSYDEVVEITAQNSIKLFNL